MYKVIWADGSGGSITTAAAIFGKGAFLKGMSNIVVSGYYGSKNAGDEAMLADEDLEGMLQESEIDVFSLIEDQILMALPFSPKHEQCGNAQLEANNQSKPNPFAALAGLKKSG